MVVLILIIVVGIGLPAWWFPYAARRRLTRNERNASAALKILAVANLDFRSNDRDHNGVKDFWTGDVSGLYHYDQLIDREFAAADSRPLEVLPPLPVPSHGYLFTVMDQDDSTSPPEDLRQDTDGKSGKVHHGTKFAFCAFPARYGETGRATFIVNQDQTLYRFDTRGMPILKWPTDRELEKTLPPRD